jgi:hypothetical protein
MGAKKINGELRSTVAKQEAMIALQQNEFHTTTAQQAKEIKALTATFEHKSPFTQDRTGAGGIQDRLYRVGVISSVAAEVAVCANEVELGGQPYSNIPLHHMHDTTNHEKRVTLNPGSPDYWDILGKNASSKFAVLTHIQNGVPHNLPARKNEFRITASSDKTLPTTKIVTIETDKNNKLLFSLRDE